MHRSCVGLLLLSAIALSAFTFTGPANAECTDKSSIRECYEDNLRQVGNALGQFKKIEFELNAKIDALKSDNAKLQGQVAQLQQGLSEVHRKAEEVSNKLPTPKDYYPKEIPQEDTNKGGPRKTHADCGNDILVSAACTNHGGAQTAVGPVFKSYDGKLGAECALYDGETASEGQIICLHKK